MKEILSLLFIITLYLQPLMAQVQIKGKVVDDQNLPLPGASVLVQGTLRGTMTDIDGNYNISALPADTLVFSMVGTATLKVGVGNRTTIDVKLLTETTMMEEVVVVGYGTQRVKDLTSSISTVKSEELTRTPASQAMQALQGKVAGLAGCDKRVTGRFTNDPCQGNWFLPRSG